MGSRTIGIGAGVAVAVTFALGWASRAVGLRHSLAHAIVEAVVVFAIVTLALSVTRATGPPRS